MDKKTMVVVGAGKGMGNHIAEVFGQNGFRLILMARQQASLDTYVSQFAEKGMEAYGIAADAADPASLTDAFRQVSDRFGAVGVLVYNACILEAGGPKELSSEELMRHYQVDVASALHSVLQVLPGMQQRGEGTILLTGGGLALHPVPAYTCVSVDKAALRALGLALHDDLKADGIFTGIVTITGNVEPGTQYDPALIAKSYWQLYTQREEAEIVL